MAAFEALYQRHFDAIYRYLHVTLGDAELAEDVVTDVFVQALTAIRTEGMSARPGRASLFALARAGAAREVPPQRLVAEPPVSDPELLALVRDLPALQREVVVLRYLIGLPAREVAEVVGRPRLVVSRAHRRAMATLERRLPQRAGGTVQPALAGVAPG
jgi:RNA polymerase sigma-70 factor (ECF subfamily)